MLELTRNIDFSTRQTPWNGLGTDISHCSNVNDALFTAGLDWEVIQKPIETIDLFPERLDGYKANVREWDNVPLGIVTDRYKVVQNRDASMTDH